MLDIKPQVLRNIAHVELDRILPGQATDIHEALVTSIVRQWMTYEGKAGVLTLAVHYWLSVEHKGTQVVLGSGVVPATLPRHLASWKVLDRDLQRIVLDLNLSQTSTFINLDGLTVQVRMDPRDRHFEFTEVPDSDVDN